VSRGGAGIQRNGLLKILSGGLQIAALPLGHAHFEIKIHGWF